MVVDRDEVLELDGDESAEVELVMVETVGTTSVMGDTGDDEDEEVIEELDDAEFDAEENTLEVPLAAAASVVQLMFEEEVS